MRVVANARRFELGPVDHFAVDADGERYRSGARKGFVVHAKVHVKIQIIDAIELEAETRMRAGPARSFGARVIDYVPKNLYVWIRKPKLQNRRTRAMRWFVLRRRR